MKQLLFFLFFFISAFNLLAQEEFYDAPRPKTPVYIDNREELLNDEETPTKQKRNERYADEDSVQKKFDPSKLRIGGNFGLQFGNYTFVNLSPTVGYIFLKDRLEVGAGPIFIYQSVRYNYNYRQSYLLYGGDFYTRGYIWKGIFAQAQYDLINKESYYKNERINVHHLLIGGGYSTPIGNVGSFYASLMYNVLNNKESVYRGTFGEFPLIMNVGFGFGINRKNK